MVECATFYRLDGPLAPAPTPRQTRASHLQGFGELVSRRGIDPCLLLERHEIDPAVLRNPDGLVGCMPFMNTIQYCASHLDLPLFGLELARLQPQLIGFVGTLCRAAPDLETALACLRDYLPVLHSPECRMELKIGRATSEIHCGSWLDIGGREQIAYGAMLSLLTFLARLTEGKFVPTYVLLRCRPASRELDRLEQEYGCKVMSGQSHDALGFGTHELARRLPSADRVSYRLLHGYADSVRIEQRQSLLARVGDFIRGALHERCDLVSCAAALGTNGRKLQLQLEAQGVSFSQLLARQREDTARTYLASDTADLDEVAHRLGYADQTSFGRAFRRWTGTSPGAYKAELARRGSS